MEAGGCVRGPIDALEHQTIAFPKGSSVYLRELDVLGWMLAGLIPLSVRGHRRDAGRRRSLWQRFAAKPSHLGRRDESLPFRRPIAACGPSVFPPPPAPHLACTSLQSPTSPPRGRRPALA